MCVSYVAPVNNSNLDYARQDHTERLNKINTRCTTTTATTTTSGARTSTAAIAPGSTTTATLAWSTTRPRCAYHRSKVADESEVSEEGEV